MRVHAPDSVAHIVDRSTLAKAHFAIVSRDGTAALLLMDTTIVAEMTDTGLARMNPREATDTIKGTANRLFARMALGALQPLFDHGIAYHLRDLADARYADGRLQLVRANGEEVFRDTEIGHGPLMESFTPARRESVRGEGERSQGLSFDRSAVVVFPAWTSSSSPCRTIPATAAFGWAPDLRRFLKPGWSERCASNGHTVRTSIAELAPDAWRAEIQTSFELMRMLSGCRS